MTDDHVRVSCVLHVDLDQFIAAVEILRRPELRGRPVVVGGDGDPTRRRQVVATASYEARAFGVHSGLPLSTALRRCPDAVFLPSDHAAYDAASVEVMDTLRTFTPLVEVWGWDEAFVGTDLDDPVALAHQIREAVLDRTQLSCSIGVGDNKLRAKLATGFAKPAGVATLTRDTWMDVMGDRPTDALWGIGARTATKLRGIGLVTVADLAAADNELLASTFGPTSGPWLGRLGRGSGDRTITSAPWVPRSRSHEETYAEDLTTHDEVARRVDALARRCMEDVAGDGRAVVRVAVKVRVVPFFTSTRIMKLAEPTLDPDAVAAGAATVLGRFELDRPVRLLGVRVELEQPQD